MSLVKIGERHQVTIPIDIFKKLRLKKGDFIEVISKDNAIVLIPSKVVPKDQAWFYTKEWQGKETKADKELAEGQFKEFDNIDDLIKDINS